MEKERRIKTISVIALIVAVLGLTVAFAVLSANLVINGTAKVDPGTWNIYFDNLTNAKIIGKAKEESAPQIDANNKTEVNNINVTLTQPKDEIEYTVDVFNEGNIDAMVSNINKPQLSSEEEKYILFTVTYDDGSELGINDLIKANGREKLKIIIKFKEDVEELPKADLSVNLSFSINYVQADDRANESHTGTPTTTKKEHYEVGEEVTLGTENFYVMKDNGKSLTMLAKYNLLVGTEVIIEQGRYKSDSLISEDTQGYGRQNEDAVGYVEGSDKIVGVTEFIPNNDSYRGYWANDDDSLKSEYGSDYPAYVYDKNSTIYNYIEYYVNYLKTLGYETSKARLMSLDEAKQLGCTYDSDNMTGSCAAASDWVYSTSYFLGTAISKKYVSEIGKPGTQSYLGAAVPISWAQFLGVRPVIEIDKVQLIK